MGGTIGVKSKERNYKLFELGFLVLNIRFIRFYRKGREEGAKDAEN
jgi:hypothetical protein